VKSLFDQGTPAPLRRFFSRHEISTACEMGWPVIRPAAERAAAAVARLAVDAYIEIDFA
jgi:hypothetical protein